MAGQINANLKVSTRKLWKKVRGEEGGCGKGVSCSSIIGIDE